MFLPKHFTTTLLLASALAVVLCAAPSASRSQSTQTIFRVGEKITYTFAYDKFQNVGYAELSADSQGTLSGKPAVELRLKIKTLGFFSAAFFDVNEERVTFSSPSSGLPLFITRTQDPGGFSIVSRTDNLKTPAVNFDLLTLLNRIRRSDGSGAADLDENGKIYLVTFQPAGSESVKTAAGEFETTLVNIESDYLTELGISDLRVNLTADENRTPVLFRMKLAKGDFRAEASSVQMINPEPGAIPEPSPSPTPKPTPTPIPLRTPDPYVNNRPLASELAFSLGETLEYRVTTEGRPVGSFVLRARERKQVAGADTLILTATVTIAAPGNPIFALNDSIIAYVDPETLSPFKVEVKMTGGLSDLSQTAVFDPKTGIVSFNENKRVEGPVGTHSLLTLLYAMRSFNLKPSKSLENPVNDTRVAVFWNDSPYVFILRPSNPEMTAFGAEKRSAQMIVVKTGDARLDPLNLRVWLANDPSRVPLRIDAGNFQADLVAVSNVSPN